MGRIFTARPGCCLSIPVWAPPHRHATVRPGEHPSGPWVALVHRRRCCWSGAHADARRALGTADPRHRRPGGRGRSTSTAAVGDADVVGVGWSSVGSRVAAKSSAAAASRTRERGRHRGIEGAEGHSHKPGTLRPDRSRRSRATPGLTYDSSPCPKVPCLLGRDWRFTCAVHRRST
jgi:hypothetical protein